MFLKRLLVCFLFVSGIAFGAGQQIDFLASGLTDTSGNPLTGGLVYTYAYGTLASKSTYVDVNMAAPKPNPIVLDTYGRSLAFADGKYKFVIKNASGTTLYTWDGLTYKNVMSNRQGTAAYSGTSTAGQLTITVAGYTDSTVKPDLYLNGVKQEYSTYTWTSALITLSSAIPVAGWTIEVIF